MRARLLATLAVASLALTGCGYNTLQTQDEAVKASWSEVVNQYQRRADLIPNLVNTVKGYAAQEERVLVGVTEARARATKCHIRRGDRIAPPLSSEMEAFKRRDESRPPRRLHTSSRRSRSASRAPRAG